MSDPKDADALARVVMLVYGQMKDGASPYWCYVSVKPSRIVDFRKAMGSKNYNMQQFEKDGYGEIIVSGTGTVPPADVTKKVADMFGAPVADLFQDPQPENIIFKKIQSLTGDI